MLYLTVYQKLFKILAKSAVAMSSLANVRWHWEVLG
jgi:hypothetical protein